MRSTEALKPLRTFERFRDQAVGLIETGADDQAGLVVCPEYFTLQLTLGAVKQLWG